MPRCFVPERDWAALHICFVPGMALANCAKNIAPVSRKRWDPPEGHGAGAGAGAAEAESEAADFMHNKLSCGQAGSPHTLTHTRTPLTQTETLRLVLLLR